MLTCRNEILGVEASTPAQATEAPNKRKLSVATKAKMRAAQKARWAKIKGTAPAVERECFGPSGPGRRDMRLRHLGKNGQGLPLARSLALNLQSQGPRAATSSGL
jgi:hypothetical protein